MYKIILIILVLGILHGCSWSTNTNNQLSSSGTGQPWVINEKALILYPFWQEKEHEPDYSRMTVQKLYSDSAIINDPSTHCWKDYYFLNVKYGNGSGETVSKQIQPTKEPFYLSRASSFLNWRESNIWLDKLEGNVLMTGYLVNTFIKWCPDCDEEEEKKSPQIELRSICPENKKNCIGIDLGYTEPHFKGVGYDNNQGAIVALYPNLRLDNIEHFDSYNKCTEHYDYNLRKIVNDGKVHSFRLVLDDGGSLERSYFWSMVREWDLIK